MIFLQHKASGSSPNSPDSGVENIGSHSSPKEIPTTYNKDNARPAKRKSTESHYGTDNLEKRIQKPMVTDASVDGDLLLDGLFGQNSNQETDQDAFLPCEPGANNYLTETSELKKELLGKILAVSEKKNSLEQKIKAVKTVKSGFEWRLKEQLSKQSEIEQIIFTLRFQYLNTSKNIELLEKNLSINKQSLFVLRKEYNSLN